MVRIILTTLFFISIVLFPWWVTLIFACFLLISVDRPFELVVGGVGMDILYSGGGEGGIVWLATIIGILFFMLSRIIRSRLRLSS